jgi:hypothetical protein
VRTGQVLSLQSGDINAGAYLKDIDTFVRQRMTLRLVKPLELLVTARIKLR